ncbi:unnamed protein product [Protopolystoma xenopodis]|uniref:Uncharacterized protein n=1 Tax=Protopolystoma xenopodis TaxID=117903 RepID=A0A448WLH7_9PLAT|nr:unnamed protein product [Protopolystoma xenopodis]
MATHKYKNPGNHVQLSYTCHEPGCGDCFSLFPISLPTAVHPSKCISLGEAEGKFACGATEKTIISYYSSAGVYLVGTPIRRGFRLYSVPRRRHLQAVKGITIEYSNTYSTLLVAIPSTGMALTFEKRLLRDEQHQVNMHQLKDHCAIYAGALAFSCPQIAAKWEKFFDGQLQGD